MEPEPIGTTRSLHGRGPQDPEAPNRRPIRSAKAFDRESTRSSRNSKVYFEVRRTPRSSTGSEDTEAPMRQVFHPERHDRLHGPKTTDATRLTSVIRDRGRRTLNPEP